MRRCHCNLISSDCSRGVVKWAVVGRGGRRGILSAVDTRALVSYLSYLISPHSARCKLQVATKHADGQPSCHASHHPRPPSPSPLPCCNSYEVIFGENPQVATCWVCSDFWAESTMLSHTSHTTRPCPCFLTPLSKLITAQCACGCVSVCCQQIFAVILHY